MTIVYYSKLTIKVEHGKDKKRLISSNYDPWPLNFRVKKQSEIDDFRASLLHLSSTPVAFEQVLPIPTDADSCTVQQQIELTLVPHSVRIRIQTELISQPQLISFQSLYVHCKAFLSQITISDEDILRVEAATRGQDQSPRWYHERQCRITSSKFGLVCKGCITVSRLISLLYDTDTAKVSSSSILWGKLQSQLLLNNITSLSKQRVMSFVNVECFFQRMVFLQHPLMRLCCLMEK